MSVRRYMQAETPPVVDRYHPRRGLPEGGVSRAGVASLAPGMDSQNARFNATANDTLIVRERTPYFAQPRYSPPAQGWTNWTTAGPLRPELGMRNMTYRPEEGASRSRFPVVASPTTGLHTNTPNGVSRTVRRYVDGNPQMVPGRIDRLAGSQYQGQTYSQTTVTQAGRGR